MPATIALGAFTFTMDALPGSPQIQNIIPDHLLWHHLLGRAVAGDSRIGLRGDRRLALSRSDAA